MPLKIELYHRIFDTAYQNKLDAERVHEGWEHKESIRDVFVLLDESAPKPDSIDLLYNDHPYYHSIEEATDHLLEEQDES